MALDFQTRYQPLIPRPFQRDAAYAELAPCPALAPYIRCFWGSTGRTQQSAPAVPRLVTPDTCADVIFRRAPDGGATVLFCALDDRPYFTPPDAISTDTFAIRFHFWALPAFCAESLHAARNTVADAGMYFPELTRSLQYEVWETKTLDGRARLAEGILSRTLRNDRLHPRVLNAVVRLIAAQGRCSSQEMVEGAGCGPRQLQRLFLPLIGLSPKRLCRLVRYQCLWRKLLAEPEPDMCGTAARFGYCDQSHLLREFREFHTMTPVRALALARSDMSLLSKT